MTGESPDSTLTNQDMSVQHNIRVYNTLTRQKEPFETIEAGRVGMYLCGPTVYAEAHIGHMVGPVIFDTIKRYLVYSGFDVNWVVNITDVDDKLIAASTKRGIPMSQVATEMTMDYLANLQALGVDQINSMPRATDNMDEIIAFIEELIEKDFAYASDGDVFFDVTRDPEYGQLSNRSVDDQQGEGGGAAAKKRSAGDFALWKSAKPGQPSWESPWGQGRPGWHIECSAMSRRILGKTFDIHGGGLDLMFPHHENELAQSRCCHGQPMVRYWMHNGLMQREGAAAKLGGRGDREQSEETSASNKISRSAGDGGLATLIEEQTGERIRFFLLRSQYRSTILFGDEALAEAGQALGTFYRLIERFERISGTSFYNDFEVCKSRSEGDARMASVTGDLMDEVKQKRASFLEKMDDDFNTGGAVSELFEMARATNRFIEKSDLEDSKKRSPEAMETLGSAMSVLRELGGILGVFAKPPKASGGDDGDGEVVDGLMQLVIKLRADARANKDFATSDTIRDGLGALGIALKDLKEGTTWEKS
ncbi:MAG: cysteine--tRNA ligase [Pirellulaceae bacterium]